MNKNLRVAVGADHAGFRYKKMIKEYLEHEGMVVTDHGTNSEDSVDYPDYVHPLAIQVEKGEADFGVLVCGSANGVCMTANKHGGIRAAIAWNKELAQLARQHNNANVICFAARFSNESEVMEMLEVFLATPFEGGRHERRVKKISEG